MNNNSLYRLWHYRERVDIAAGTLCMAGCTALLVGCALFRHDYAAASYGFGVATGCLMGVGTMRTLYLLDRDDH